ncbi:hypothetical protein [Bradyrhizobium sp. STM 3562]|uniref:hypothetical protein n=1 Tax=Bradyrhizobium sp. STM 3562 TaxID=578924 RepID=UPI00389007D1
MNMLVSSAVAGVATVSPIEAAHPDAKIIAAGVRFEKLLPKYMTAWFEWARLHREARAETYAKFGEDYCSPAWTEPDGAHSPAFLFLQQALACNGARQAADTESALHDEMNPIAELIRDAEIQSLAGLRAKALVAIWDCRPGVAEHTGDLNLDNEWSLYSLLTGTIAVTGLSDLFGSFVEQVRKDAIVKTRELPEATSAAMIPSPADPIFVAIEAHKQAYDAFSESLEEQSKLEETIPKARRQTEFGWDSDGVKIVETDDPRWISHEIRKHELSRAENDCELQLVSVVPTTLQGVAALVTYCNSMEEKGHSWPSDLVDDDYDENAPPEERFNKTHTWQYYLNANIRECLRSLSA